MRTTLILTLGMLAAAPSAVAQGILEIHPGTVEFTSRGTVDSSDGETLMGFHAATHQGIGGITTGCHILGLRAECQDQNAETSESFSWVIRHGDDANGPSRSATELVTKIGSFSTPTGTGSKAWSLSTTFPTPATLKDCVSHFSAGLALSAANWPADGLSTHAATYSIQKSHSRQGDHAWNFVGSTTVATHPSHHRTWRYSLIVPGVALQLGNNGRMGMGGMYPRVGQPLTAWVRGGASKANAAGVVVLSSRTSRLDGSARIGFGAGLFLKPSYHFWFVTADNNGTASAQILNEVPAAFAQAGTFHFQAILDKNGALYFSNCATVIP